MPKRKPKDLEQVHKDLFAAGVEFMQSITEIAKVKAQEALDQLKEGIDNLGKEEKK